MGDGALRRRSGADLLRAISSRRSCRTIRSTQRKFRIEAARKAFPRLPASLANSSGLFLGMRPIYDLARPGMRSMAAIRPLGVEPDGAELWLLSVVVQQTGWIEARATCGYNAQWTARCARASRRCWRGATQRSAAGAGATRRAAGGRGRHRGTAPPAGRPRFDGSDHRRRDRPPRTPCFPASGPKFFGARRRPRRFRRAQRHDRLSGADRVGSGPAEYAVGSPSLCFPPRSQNNSKGKQRVEFLKLKLSHEARGGFLQPADILASRRRLLGPGRFVIADAAAEIIVGPGYEGDLRKAPSAPGFGVR